MEAFLNKSYHHLNDKLYCNSSSSSFTRSLVSEEEGEEQQHSNYTLHHTNISAVLKLSSQDFGHLSPRPQSAHYQPPWLPNEQEEEEEEEEEKLIF